MGTSIAGEIVDSCISLNGPGSFSDLSASLLYVLTKPKDVKFDLVLDSTVKVGATVLKVSGVEMLYGVEPRHTSGPLLGSQSFALRVNLSVDVDTENASSTFYMQLPTRAFALVVSLTSLESRVNVCPRTLVRVVLPREIHSGDSLGEIKL
jgi:hypothetical protein